jgi:hypothetical protein
VEVRRHDADIFTAWQQRLFAKQEVMINFFFIQLKLKVVDTSVVRREAHIFYCLEAIAPSKMS